MPNLSQIKRQRMLEFLNRIRQEHTDDEALIAINEIEAELTSKKYGLVWEEHEERVDIEMQHNVPVFTEVTDREIVSDSSLPYNFLLEGDNLHSLKLLEKTHKGKIDVIYIDPPYNTGNKDFIYDDNKIDSQDGFRHSKWLSFMQQRLQIAHTLLSDRGTIFISIDDNEHSQLKLLCDEIFGGDNFVSSLPRITKKSGKAHSETVAKNHDYLLIYTKNSTTSFRGISGNIKGFDNEDEYVAQRGKYKLNQTLDYDSLWYNPAMDFPIQIEDEIFYAGGSCESHLARHNGNHNAKDWVWRWSQAKFDFGYANGFVVIKKGKNRSRIYTKTYLNASIEKNSDGYYIQYSDRETKMSSLAFVENEYSNDNAKKELAQYINANAFDFPKPTSLIKEILTICSDKNSIILDFFAGSGTTGHAVIKMNTEDGGNRQFILCTNNENNICEEVTFERIKSVICGSGDNSAIPANLKYYKTDFIPKSSDELEYSVSDELLKHIAEMVQLEYAVKLDGTNYILAMSDEEADTIISDNDRLNSCQALYVSAAVLLTAEQQRELTDREIAVYVIPDYYFETELLEVGER